MTAPTLLRVIAADLLLQTCGKPAGTTTRLRHFAEVIRRCMWKVAAMWSRESSREPCVSYAGISGLTDTEQAGSFQEMNQEQYSQEPNQQAEQDHGENGMPLSAAPEQVVKQDVLLQPKAEAPQPPQPINLYPNFPMPPDMHMGMSSTSPAADPWRGEEQPDGGFTPHGRQLRQRPQQRAKGRKREHSPGWSPIGVRVQKRLR